MTQLRIDIGELPEELRKALDEGREVLLEDHGRVVARVEGCEKDTSAARGGDLRAFAEARRKAPRLDEDWERDMAQIAEWINRPAEPPLRDREGGDLNTLVKELRKLPPLDDDYERDMALIASWVNRPAQHSPWE